MFHSAQHCSNCKTTDVLCNLFVTLYDLHLRLLPINAKMLFITLSADDHVRSLVQRVLETKKQHLYVSIFSEFHPKFMKTFSDVDKIFH